MGVRYKIQAACTLQYDSHSFENKGIETYHFWQLIKQYTHLDGESSVEIVDACYTGFYGISQALTQSKQCKNFSTIRPDYTHIVYGDKVDETDAKKRWNEAIKNIIRFLPSEDFTQHPQLLYHGFAEWLGIEAYSFIRSISINHPLKHQLSSYTLNNHLIGTSAHYKIKAVMNCIVLRYRSMSIKPFPINNMRAGHHFWMLVKEEKGQEEIIEKIEGLGTQYQTINGQSKAVIPTSLVQSWGAVLKVYSKKISENSTSIPILEQRCRSGKPWQMPEYQTKVMYGERPEEKENVLLRWKQARRAMSMLNAKDPIPYSFFGLGKTLGIRAINSNSVYATLALALHLPAHRFKGYLAPGINTVLLSPAELEDCSLSHQRSFSTI